MSKIMTLCLNLLKVYRENCRLFFRTQCIIYRYLQDFLQVGFDSLGVSCFVNSILTHTCSFNVNLTSLYKVK